MKPSIYYAINAAKIANVASAISAEEYVPGSILAFCRSSGNAASKHVYAINTHVLDDPKQIVLEIPCQYRFFR